MRKISIKTVDGERFDYTDSKIFDYATILNDWTSSGFISCPIEDGYKYINKDNIVSITVREIDNA